MKDPYSVVKSLHVTEKSQVLAELHAAKSNPSVAKFELPKAVFVVDLKANKHQIKEAVEEIYKARGVKVVSVNTLIVKPKQKQRGRFRPGATNAFKKAVVTFRKGDSLE